MPVLDQLMVLLFWWSVCYLLYAVSNTAVVSVTAIGHAANKLCKYWADRRDPLIKQLGSSAVLPLYPSVPPCCEDSVWRLVGSLSSAAAATVAASGTVVPVLADVVFDTLMSGAVIAAMAVLATSVTVIAMVLLLT